MPRSLPTLRPLERVLSTFGKVDVFPEVEEGICGQCEYCDAAAESKIRKKEPPGALFCQDKQIKFRTLLRLKISTFSLYVLNTGNLTEEDYPGSGVGLAEIKSKKTTTATIVIPFILFEIFQDLRKAHEEELQENEFFLSVVRHMNVRNVKLNKLLDLLISQDLSSQRLGRLSEVKALDRLKNLNAFELFSLIIIFLNRLPHPIWRLTTEASKMLLKLSDELPHDADTIVEQKRNLIQSVIDASCENKEGMRDITDQIRELFNVEGGTQLQIKTLKNTLFHQIKSNLDKLKPGMRKNIIQVVVRNFRFELCRHTYNIFKQRSNAAESPKDKQVKLEMIFAQEVANLSVCCGPVILRLSDGLDTRANRIRAMTSLLFYFDGSVMYCLEKNESVPEKVMSCHPDCPCGFGEAFNINDPAFRDLFIGAPFLNSMEKQDRPKKPTCKPQNRQKKRRCLGKSVDVK